jgi:hypothetical protein
MPQVTLKEECEIILKVKNPDGTISPQRLWVAAKGEVLKLNPARAAKERRKGRV